MKAYVLGLADEFRGAALLERLRELGFDAEMVPGVDGRILSADEVRTLWDPAVARVTVGRALAGAEIACALGHQRMYERVVAGSDRWALLFEDDVTIEAGVLDVLPDLDSLPAQSIVTLRHDEAGALVCNPFARTPASVRRLVAVPMGASAYFIDRAAAELALTTTSGRPVNGAPDWPIAWAPHVHWWVSRRNLSPHTQSHSLLEPGRANRVSDFSPPWGNAGIGDRIRWMLRLHRSGFDWTSSRRTALTGPLLNRLLRLAAPRATRPDA